MPPVYQIRFTRDAASQLKSIYESIVKESAQGAGTMIGRLIEAIDALNLFPHRYKVLEDVRAFGEAVRSMPVPPYLIRYHVDDDRLCVTVLSVRHGARRPTSETGAEDPRSL